MSNFEYVDAEAVEQVKCSVCLQVFIDPVRVCKNEHHLCRECAEGIRNGPSNARKCPECRERLRISVCQHFLRIHMEGLCVRCPNHVRGCSETPSRKGLDAHLAICPHVLVQCEQCGLEMERRLLAMHHHCEAASFGCNFVSDNSKEVVEHMSGCAACTRLQIYNEGLKAQAMEIMKTFGYFGDEFPIEMESVILNKIQSKFGCALDNAAQEVVRKALPMLVTTDLTQRLSYRRRAWSYKHNRSGKVLISDTALKKLADSRPSLPVVAMQLIEGSSSALMDSLLEDLVDEIKIFCSEYHMAFGSADKSPDNEVGSVSCGSTDSDFDPESSFESCESSSDIPLAKMRRRV
eukprot:gnl/MRDRNA2_/MRDRNA2_97837_c0_seq1.p1 gnl/MRDRNA2_/MRDRNA2_97837_c0~~gnl/MRDRNA2_/MRDRNA2_97837_c0_seq1.p1  ORF type:complete len:349 (-),score=45.97 gnl/MRDRNA2_/MRDRNA2_97837_c0_seq1:184-1230(-)